MLVFLLPLCKQKRIKSQKFKSFVAKFLKNAEFRILEKAANFIIFMFFISDNIENERISYETPLIYRLHQSLWRTIQQHRVLQRQIAQGSDRCSC